MKNPKLGDSRPNVEAKCGSNQAVSPGPDLEVKSCLNSQMQSNKRSLIAKQQYNKKTIYLESSKVSNIQSLPAKNQTIKLSKVIKQNQTPQKKSLPIRQFQYCQTKMQIKKRTLSQIRSKTSSQSNLITQNIKLDNMPIKIVKDKIILERNTKIELQRGATQRNIIVYKNSQPQTDANPQLQNQSDGEEDHLWVSTPNFQHKTAARQIYQQRRDTYNPKLTIFQRYNYENYENYKYKNPFKKHKFQSIIKQNKPSTRYDFPKNSKYQINKGSAKNLEIVFCEKKYPDFVKKTNQIVQKSKNNPISQQIKSELTPINLTSRIAESHCSHESSLRQLKKNIMQQFDLKSRHLLNTNNAIKWTYSPQKNKLSMRKTSQQIRAKILINKNINPRSTLQKLLQEFKALEKLTLLNQKQQQRSPIRKKQVIQDFSKTAFVNLLINKFSFLQNLNRSFRNHLLKTLFDLESINDESKISIHDFLKFNRIFISNDSRPEEVSEFVFLLLFKNCLRPSVEAGKKVLNQLNPKNKQKLQVTISTLFELCEENQLSYEKMMEILMQNTGVVFWIIELIKDQ